MKINEFEPWDWRAIHVEHLKNYSLKLKYKLLFYFILADELYKQLSYEILARYLRENETYISLDEVHEGRYEIHHALDKMK